MLAHAVCTSGILAVASVVSKAVTDPSERASGAVELLRQALHWQDVAVQDSDPALRLQHATRAQAMLDAARIVMTDIELERSSGVHVQRTARELDALSSDARQSVTKRAARPK